MSETANTDRELWRETEGDYYSPRIFVTSQGGIGIDVGGHCIVRPIKGWFDLAAKLAPLPAPNYGSGAPGDERPPRITSRPDVASMSGPALLEYCGDRGDRWAAAFCSVARNKGIELDEGWMIGWFANAIEHSSQMRKPQCQALALDLALTGINHIATYRNEKWPEVGTDHNVALEALGAGREYDMWCCWNAGMRAAQMIRHAA